MDTQRRIFRLADKHSIFHSEHNCEKFAILDKCSFPGDALKMIREYAGFSSKKENNDPLKMVKKCVGWVRKLFW